MSLSGSLSLTVYLRMSVSGYDDKFSPFSAVTGYRWASFPQNANEQYAHALSKNNPIQMKTEYWSTTTSSYYTGETADFNYTYNDQGYPTKIIITTTYTPELTPAFKNVKIYEFTYR